MKWLDAEDIGIALFESFLHRPADRPFHRPSRKSVGLTDFDDDPKTSNEPKLEAIQMAWYEEWKENQ